MKALLAFPRAMLDMPAIWQAWMALMIALNAVVPIALIVVNGLSLVIDVFDFVRYLRGDQEIPVRRRDE